MMRYILNTLGVEKEATKFAEFNALFSKKVISFMEDFTIADKYKPRIFIEKSQSNVLSKTNPNKETYVAPKPNEIYIWLVHNSSSFIFIQFGTNIARDLKKKEITKEFLEDLILSVVKTELDNKSFSKNKVETATRKGLAKAMSSLVILDDINTNETHKEVFKTNPALYLALKGAQLGISELEALKFKEHRWNPKLSNFSPFIQGDTLNNALVCGFINGIIDEAKAIPEMAVFFSKTLGSKKEKEAFINGLKKLFEEGIFQAIIEGATKEYAKALQEGSVERLYYNLGHDVIQIVSLLIGVFQLANGIVSFMKFSRKGLQYIKRYGRKGIDKLKKLNKRQIKETFDDLDDSKPLRIKLKTVKMKSNYIGEETGIDSWCAPSKVKYFDEFERIKYKLTIKDGKLFDSKGVLFDTSKAGTIHSGKGRVMFVMDENGIIYASKFQIRGKLHHSSFLAGKPVASAGELKVVNGVVKEISRKSGHYTPSKVINKQIVKVLKSSGVETKSIKIIDGF